MRKWLLISVMAAFGFAAAGPAMAEVNIDVTIDKLKIKRVIELIVKIKLVRLVAIVFIEPDKFAESEALFNQVNKHNEACENCAEKTSEILNSVNFNTGITTVNQATGNMNNQGNIISVAVDAFVEETNGNGTIVLSKGFAESQAAGEQVMKHNLINTINILFRDAVIDHSINDNIGLTQVNQSVANMMNQANAISIAVSLVPGVALSEADLGQVNKHNDVFETDVIKNVLLDHSINRNLGVTQVNQAGGNNGNQANVVSVAAAI